MNTNAQITKDECLWCSNSKVREQKFCPYCGRATGRVWGPILSQYEKIGSVKNIEIENGGSFFIRFEHIYGESVDIYCDISDAPNVLFKKDPTETQGFVQVNKNIDNKCFEFCLKDYKKQPSGIIRFRLNNGLRNLNEIWKNNNFEEISYQIDGKVAVASSEWNLGSEFLFFSNKIERQNICIYNPSSIDRNFVIDPPSGYNVYSNDSFGNTEISIKANSNAVLSIEKNNMNLEKAPYWEIANQKVELVEVKPQQKNKNRRKLRISFDLGAKTFSIRACWVGGHPMLSKNNCCIEDIGGKYFSSSMIIDKTGRGEFYCFNNVDDFKQKYFSYDNEKAKKIKTIDDCILHLPNTKNLVAITGLKTLIRFNQKRSDLDNEFLLGKFFSEVYKIMKQWAKELFPKANKSIPTGFKLNTFFKPDYIFTYPILEKEDEIKRYIDTFKNAFNKAFSEENIEESQISFISEPEVILNYMVLEKNDIFKTLSEDDLFATVDSGAGTTDLSVGKIKKDKGIVTLTDIKSIHLELTDEQKSKYPPAIQKTPYLGGNLLDFIFSDALDKNAYLISTFSNGTYISFWKAVWGDESNSPTKTKEKLAFCKNIKEQFEKEANENKKNPTRHILNRENYLQEEDVGFDYKSYGNVVIESIFKDIVVEAYDKLFSMGINCKKVNTIALVGGSNICRYVRNSIFSNLHLTLEATKQDGFLTDYDRLYAVVEGACLPVEPLSKTTSFAKFTIKYESDEEIIEEIIKEEEVLSEKSFQIDVPYNESNIAILELFAESKLWEGNKKIATAISKKDNSDDEEAFFVVTVTDKKCVCTDGGRQIFWDINIS